VRRCVVKEDVIKFLSKSFETSELIKIEMSRWSKTKSIGVVDHGDVVDLEMMLKDKHTVGFNKGLSSEENKNRRIDAGIDYGQVKAGSVAAYNSSSGSSVKTTTAGKAFSTSPARIQDSDSFAKSAISFDVASTVAHSIVIEADSSISSIYSIESMNQDKVTYGPNKKESSKAEEMDATKSKIQEKGEDNPDDDLAKKDDQK
jgi:hypothetical protein